jgi:hypothetical protein
VQGNRNDRNISGVRSARLQAPLTCCGDQISKNSAPADAGGGGASAQGTSGRVSSGWRRRTNAKRLLWKQRDGEWARQSCDGAMASGSQLLLGYPS